MEIGPDEDDEFTDIREQIFHNTVREQIVSFIRFIPNLDLIEFKRNNQKKKNYIKFIAQTNSKLFGQKENVYMWKLIAEWNVKSQK